MLICLLESKHHVHRSHDHTLSSALLELHLHEASATFLPHSRCRELWQNVPYRIRQTLLQTADCFRPFRRLRKLSGKLQENLCIWYLESDFQTSGFCLLLQRNSQHLRQSLATLGSPPQNTLTRPRTQIIFFRHIDLQNLRQGRYALFSGE